MFYNILLVSAIHQHESAIGMRVPSLLNLLPKSTPFHSSRLLQSTRFELPVSYSKVPLAIYFQYGNVSVSMFLLQLVPPSPFTTVSTSLFSISVSPLLLYKYVHQYYLSTFHIYVQIHDICFSLSYFSLYNRL